MVAVREVAAMGEDEAVLVALDALLQARLLEEVPRGDPPAVRFRHEVVARALLEGMSAPQRSLLRHRAL